jgi:UDP-N-acetylglucosamine acyltransferase
LGRPFNWIRPVSLKAHVVVDGHTIIWIGDEDLSCCLHWFGPTISELQEPSQRIIGKNNTIREHVAMNPGTAAGSLRTVTDDHCLFMVGAHVALDCLIGKSTH